ncbi:50S ribosomal protein L13 [Patescibacteria group bacterium]|nr:50S ribosomal protein L13 [Patescibacteria group bacterium]
MKTTHPKLADMNANREWYLVDAKNQVLGKLATKIADTLRGKNKPCWHPSVDCGDNVVVINAEKVVLTGQKEEKKQYITHSKYPGGLKTKTARNVRESHPERIIEGAVAGMMPRNRLRKHILSKLKVYAGENHPHTAQQLKPLK